MTHPGVMCPCETVKLALRRPLYPTSCPFVARLPLFCPRGSFMSSLCHHLCRPNSEKDLHVCAEENRENGKNRENRENREGRIFCSCRGCHLQQSMHRSCCIRDNGHNDFWGDCRTVARRNRFMLFPSNVLNDKCRANDKGPCSDKGPYSDIVGTWAFVGIWAFVVWNCSW
jgi:hypothetical protein